ncbi:hypothetical protein GTW25_01165 [Aliihoeflea aestuarii]|jgi:hypothetical protein|uniref:hypothetical protein n=1 Tax=Aliihoeflea aestuarii TaxID=453840 RepID=UPI0020924D87|nr:hypothetical protein [Aliihoeflea aestuarii]MCO6389641.1 hypothetical protein [Aliihoeflea aestuarii]
MTQADRPEYDSRAWTGPAAPPPRFDRRAARRTFEEAGGRKARASQIIVGVIFAIALIPIGLSGLIGNGGAHGLAPGGGPVDALMRLGGDPRSRIVCLAILAAGAGLLAARLNRNALNVGFAAVEDAQPGAVYTTRRIYLVAPFLVLCTTASPPSSNLWGPVSVLVWWLGAYLLSASITAIGERRFAGRGADGMARSGWDLANIIVSLSALSVLLTYLLGFSA